MTTGTMTTKNGENTLKVEDVTIKWFGWYARIIGGDCHDFSDGWWDFTEDKPSPAEQYKALEPGTIFVISDPSSVHKFLKISDEKYYSILFGRIHPVGQYEFGDDLYVVEEVSNGLQ